MGNICCRETSVSPSVDVYLDKLITYIVLPVIFLLGFISIIVLYLVDRITCYDQSINNRDYLAEGYCWNSFRTATLVPGSSKWITGRELQHKNFPIIMMCEPVALALPLIIWYWCFGRDFANEIQSVIDHSNNLTDYFRKYDKGMRRTVTEATLHREIDNILEYLAYLLMTKSRRIYVFYVLKWFSLLFVVIICIVGCFGILYPEFDVIFADKFTCLVIPDTPTPPPISTQRIAVCNIPTYMFLRAAWYFNVIVLGLLIFGILAHLIELSMPSKYTNTFFYRSIPGIMDSRLAGCIQKHYNSKHFHLISKFCDQNTNLSNDIGLSKSLSRKYGIFEGRTPGRETLMDKHFPVIQPEQIEKFRVSTVMFFRKKPEKKTKSKPVLKQAKVGPLTDRHIAASGSGNISSGYDSPRTSRDIDDSINYMTPYLMARKLEKDERDMFSLNNTIVSYNQTPIPTHRSMMSDITFEDLEFETSTPRPGRKIDTENTRLYGKKSGVKFEAFDPKAAGHHPKFASRTKELNPFAYRLRTIMRQNKANDTKTWRP